MTRRVAGICRAERQHSQQDHLKATTRVWRQRQVAPANQAHLVIKLHIFGRQRLSQGQHAVAVAMTVVDTVRQRLGNGHAMEDVEDLRQHAIPVRALLGQMAHGLKHGLGITFDQGVQQVEHLTVIQRAKHRPHITCQYLAFAEGNRLVGEAHGIAHRTVGSAAQQPQRVVFERHVLDTEHMAQMLDHTLRCHVFQRKLQATRQDRGRQFLRIGGREDELDVGRRFFKGLEQRIERMAGEHVHFVDQVDLEAPATRCVLHVVEQLTGVLDLGAAGGVDLDQVDKAALVDFTAHRALTARR